MKSLLLSSLIAASVDAAFASWKKDRKCVGTELTKDTSMDLAKQTSVTCQGFCLNYVDKTLRPFSTKKDQAWCCVFDPAGTGCQVLEPKPDDTKLWLYESVGSNYHFVRWSYATKKLMELTLSAYSYQIDVKVWTPGVSCAMRGADKKITNAIGSPLLDKAKANPATAAACQVLCLQAYDGSSEKGKADACCYSEGPGRACGLYNASTFEAGLSFNGNGQQMFKGVPLYQKYSKVLGPNVNYGAFIIAKATGFPVSPVTQKLWRVPVKGGVGYSCKAGSDGKREVGACTTATQCCGSYKKADATFVDVCNLAAATKFTVGGRALPFQCIPTKGSIGYGCKAGADGKREVGGCLATGQCCGAYKKAAADATQIEVCNTDKATKFTDFYTKEYDFACIEGAKNILVSASALLTASYMLA